MADYKYLSKINSPADLKCLQEDKIAPLASEIRDFLIEKVTENGGHLASNLGAVELTLAIHRTFDVPNDHLIFDVSHQSYVHKIVTGRKDNFDTLRQGGGLSGFMKRSESKYDCFGAGHSSTSVSAGLGFAQADKLHNSDAYTVVVLGDGAFTGGMIHEALNNIENDLKLIIILNENEMSISKNIGSFAKILIRLRMHPSYISTKGFIRTAISKIPFVGNPLVAFIKGLKRRIKDVLYGSNYFENLGLFYVGPVDGNNEKDVEEALKIAKKCGQSAIVHVKTVKGKGYEPAEKNPAEYHGISPKGAEKHSSSFSSELGVALTELANNDENVVAITAAMLHGTGLIEFSKKYPDRVFDVGIAEEHALTFACGLAAQGAKPYFAVYSTFLQRSYDNILHDMALQNLPVKICIDRAGLNSADGPTHHGIYDVAMLSHVPNMTLYTPISYEGLRASLREMSTIDKPCAVRYPKGAENNVIIAEFLNDNAKELSVRANYQSPNELDVVIITHGSITAEAIQAKHILENDGINVGIILVERLMPYADLAADVIKLLPKNEAKIITLEEEIKAGGFGMMLLDRLCKNEIMNNKKTAIIALEDSMADKYGHSIYSSFGLDANSIADKIRNI